MYSTIYLANVASCHAAKDDKSLRGSDSVIIAFTCGSGIKVVNNGSMIGLDLLFLKKSEYN